MYLSLVPGFSGFLISYLPIHFTTAVPNVTDDPGEEGSVETEEKKKEQGTVYAQCHATIRMYMYTASCFLQI